MNPPACPQVAAVLATVPGLGLAAMSAPGHPVTGRTPLRHVEAWVAQIVAAGTPAARP